jgi:hypothetical protein
MILNENFRHLETSRYPTLLICGLGAPDYQLVQRIYGFENNTRQESEGLTDEEKRLSQARTLTANVLGNIQGICRANAA